MTHKQNKSSHSIHASSS